MTGAELKERFQETFKGHPPHAAITGILMCDGQKLRLLIEEASYALDRAIELKQQAEDSASRAIARAAHY